MRCVLAIIWDKSGTGEILYELPEKEFTAQLLTALTEVTPKLTLWERVKYIFHPHFLLGEKDYAKAIDVPLQSFKLRTQKAHVERDTIRQVRIKKLRAKQSSEDNEGYIIQTTPSELYRTVVGNTKEN